MNEPTIAGLRVLLVEDETLMAIMLEDVLTDAGCEIVGPAPRLSTAEQLLDARGADVAILDINLAGERAYSFAGILAERNVPFLFLTGYSVADIDRQFADRPVLRKPFRNAQLVQALHEIRAGSHVP